MHKINWGIIGCGDVTELKSGPAFNKVANSTLVAVMRRDGAKAADYARRHKVPAWYDDASRLIADPQVNAIYIATPPSSHAAYCYAAIDAGKPVYVEKPMALNSGEAFEMAAYAAAKNVKLTVAHYRRAQPMYKKIKQLLDDNTIGDVRLAKLDYYRRALSEADLQQPKTAWRVDAAISGGGLFHDLAPHQLDMMFNFFGPVNKANGIATSQGIATSVHDLVAGNILFKNGVVFNGAWCFNAPTGEEKDACEIIGATGKISFSFFETKPVTLTINGQTQHLQFDALPHVQQPMIENVVSYFLGEGPNPCTPGDGVEVMKVMDAFTKA